MPIIVYETIKSIKCSTAWAQLQIGQDRQCRKLFPEQKKFHMKQRRLEGVPFVIVDDGGQDKQNIMLNRLSKANHHYNYWYY